jgi:hypothetical protein
MRMIVIVGALVASLAVSACAAAPTGSEPTGSAPTGSAPTSSAAAGAEQMFPDIVAADAERSGTALRFTVTVSSPYDTPQRYADAFRVRTAAGAVLGVRELAHDHATEQPFTRTLDGVVVPAGTTSVVVEGRDLVHGWGGATVTVELPV